MNEQRYMLDSRERNERIGAISKLKSALPEYDRESRRDTNNHIHSKYSFSPYYPAKAAFLAYEAGLATAGLVDHDSCAGAEEFIAAAGILGLPVTTGLEVRVDMRDTPLADFRLNNPEQTGNAYVTLQGLPHHKLGYINKYLEAYRKERFNRIKKMSEEIGILLKKYDIGYSFQNDVLPVSEYHDGGTITERHMLFGLALKLIAMLGKGEGLTRYLGRECGMKIPDKAKVLLDDVKNPYYEYDMLGLLKAEYLDKVYIRADKECPKVKDFLRLADETGAIPAYCYLGDQGNCVTGDKKEMEFEDKNLETIIAEVKEMGFKAVEYMPARNTDEQIIRLKNLCLKYDLFEICGEDINQPRQKFICEKMRQPLFKDAYNNSMALVSYEMALSKCKQESMNPANQQ